MSIFKVEIMLTFRREKVGLQIVIQELDLKLMFYTAFGQDYSIWQKVEFKSTFLFESRLCKLRLT